MGTTEPSVVAADTEVEDALDVVASSDLGLGVGGGDGLSANVPVGDGDVGGLAVVGVDFAIVLEAVVILSANALAICAATSAQS